MPTADLKDHARCPNPVSRWVLAGVGAGFLVVTFAQARGVIEDDTKLSLILTPVAYFKSALHLWSDHLFGGAATQSVDLFVPIGPFFALTQFLHVPTWCAERLWLALLLTVGCWGVVRLAEALGIGKPYARVLAGVAYCAAPIVLSWTTTTAALLAVVLLPWVVQPLVVGSVDGSSRRAAGRSGLAVALMGGANATVVLAVLPVAALWLLTREPGPRRRTLMGWWVVAVGCACFWWAITLVIVGRYGYNYLPYTETAAVTTSTASAFESLRGASFWTDYYALGGALLPGAWTIVSSAVVIVATSVVTALGLAGLCRRTPERLFLVASMAFGAVAIAIGYAGPFGGPFAHALQPLLDTSLAPLRNVTKFAPDVALPLALGLASILSPEPLTHARRARTGVWVSARAVAFGAVAVAAIVIATTPFWRLQLYGSGGFTAIPHYWSQAGEWLDAHQGHQNALLVPGASSAQYTWGSPLDEPLEVVGDTSLLWSDVIPLGSNGSTQTLTTVEQTLDSGISPPGFGLFLAREGIKYVIERNDLNWSATGGPPPAQVHQVLAETAGLTEVASFGPILPQHQVQVGTLPVYDSPAYTHLRAVEIFRVDSSASAVHTYPVANPVVVSGDAGSLLPLEGADVLKGRVSFLSGDLLARGAPKAAESTWAITDGNQRRDVSFGAIRNNTSYVLGPGQSSSTKPADIPLLYSVVPGTQHETVEAPIGAAAVSASSYGSALFAQPSEGPYSAFDGNPSTAWVADATDDSVGQWISITFDRPVSLKTITVTPLAGSAQQPSITQLTISTDRGTATRSLPDSASPVRLTVPAGKSRYLKITIAGVRPPSQLLPSGIAGGAGITDIRIPGVFFHENMKAPNDEARSFTGSRRNPPIVVFNRPLPNTNLSLGSSLTDDPTMARTFVIPKAMAADITGYAVPVPGSVLESLLNFLTPTVSADQQISASSWLGYLPRFRAENLQDNAGVPWIAALGDTQPSLTLTWNGPRTVDSIVLTPTPQASRPTEISVSGAAGLPQVLRVPRHGGVIRFLPLVTNILRVQFLRNAPKTTISPAYDVPMVVPVGLASVRIPGLDNAASVPPNASYTFSLGCGQGPPILVDGVATPTSVSASLGDLLSLRPVEITACTAPDGVQLTQGHHSVEAASSSAPFEITSLVIQNSPSLFASGYGYTARTASIEHWNAESRTVRVGPGAGTYLVIPQNYNAAWVATLGSRTLAPVRIDGWQQGYVVPSGPAGTVQLTMRPDGLFHLGLLLGALLLVALLLLTLLPSKKPEPELVGARPVPAFWLLAICAVGALFLVGGALALVALPLMWAARRWGGGLMAIVAFVAFVGAGLAVAMDPGALPKMQIGAFGPTAQIASVVALAAVLSAAAADRRPLMVRAAASADEKASAGVRRDPTPNVDEEWLDAPS